MEQYLHFSHVDRVAPQTCLSGSTGVEDIADGEVPMFQIAEWEVDNYTRPAYDALPLVEELHGWGRISGGNDFDLDDRFYGKYG